MKIGIFGYYHIKNIGDIMILQNTEYLINKIDKNIECIHCGLQSDINGIPVKYRIDHFVGNVIKWGILKLFGKKGDIEYRDLAYKIQYYRYYRDLIKRCDKIIYGVGLLNYSVQHTSYHFSLINSLACKYSKPILMNAMSIEKSDCDDWRFYQTINSINMPSVKMITTRDGTPGVDRLEKFYVKNKDIFVDYVGDPALWNSESSNIRKNPESDCIGIGLIRYDIYNNYKEEKFSGESLKDFYKQLILELLSRGYKIRLFSNGMLCDQSFGKDIIREMNLPEDYLLPAPRTIEELTKNIASFKAIFGARLHACITAVSLGVPVAGLLWDNKLKFFCESMKIEKFFSTTKELTGKRVADKIELAICYDFDYDNRDYYKSKTLQSIRQFLNMENNESQS